jgi:hypothetical protein
VQAALEARAYLQTHMFAFDRPNALTVSHGVFNASVASGAAPPTRLTAN